MNAKLILTHPGGAHKDEFLASCLLAAEYEAPIVRREPTQEDLDDLATWVLDVGDEHDPARNNFDHHQFPRDHEPICALSLVLQKLGLYDDARNFCDWLEPAEWFDTRGPGGTAEWLGVEREVIFKLNSPIDGTLLRRFSQADRVDPGETLYEAMQWIGSDLINYIRSLRKRLAFIAEHAEIWDLEKDGDRFKVLFMPRTEPLPDEPSHGLPRYLDSLDISGEVAGLIYPDRRGSGYGLSRHNDCPRLEFTLLEAEEDVHFAHARGFVAKSSATEKGRLQELVRKAWK